MGTDIFVLVTLGQDQKQALAHLNSASAFRAGEQRRLQSLE